MNRPYELGDIVGRLDYAANYTGIVLRPQLVPSSVLILWLLPPQVESTSPLELFWVGVMTREELLTHPSATVRKAATNTLHLWDY